MDTNSLILKSFAEDPRGVMTLDAGGTQVVFGAIQGGRPVIDPIRLATHGDDLDRCLGGIIEGFSTVKSRLSAEPAAISFAFPGPADYRNGVIGDLTNLPGFRGGVPLQAILEERFGIPVFINNDGDLFTYGEAIGGFLPKMKEALEAVGSDRRFENLLGITLGTGFGAGLVTGGRLFQGDNGSGMEIWSTRGRRPDLLAEEEVSIRGLKGYFASSAGIPLGEAPEPHEISRILEDGSETERLAALCAYLKFGQAVGEALADAVCLTDSLIVVGGGISRGHHHFLNTAVATMNGSLNRENSGSAPRMEVRAFNFEDPDQRNQFLGLRTCEVGVPGSQRTVRYAASKGVAIGVSVLGTSEAVALGAYAYALARLPSS